MCSTKTYLALLKFFDRACIFHEQSGYTLLSKQQYDLAKITREGLSDGNFNHVPTALVLMEEILNTIQ